MITTLRNRSFQRNLAIWLIAAAVLALAFLLGQRASLRWLGALAAGLGGLVLLTQPALGLLALVAAALILPFQIGTGTEVKINPAALLVPALLVVWLLDGVRRRDIRLVPSPTTRPLALFLLAGLLSLLIGRATWDPLVPVGGNFLLVQLAQWSIFAFSAGAFWLTANLAKDVAWLWRLTTTFLLLAGGVAILHALPDLRGLTISLTPGAITRAPFWMLLSAVAGGQLLFNRGLSLVWRSFLLVVLGAVFLYAFVQQKDTASNWVGVATAVGVLVWLRFRRLRVLLVVIVAVLILFGAFFPTLYNFAGGDEEWTISGGSRQVLIGRVLEVTMRNPLTGLGPAAYRPYANMKPLPYQNAYWVAPRINSHNNYVDLFSQVGIVGLALFLWFVIETTLLGHRLRRRYPQGFAAGYVNGVLAAGAGALVIMALADWILPFVYNIGFQGFQASVLMWIFLGGLVALENMPDSQDEGFG